MAQPTRKPPHVPASPVDRGDIRIAENCTGPPATGRRSLVTAPRSSVKAHIIRQVVVLDVVGRLGDVGEELDLAIQLALADGALGVVCNLSAALDVDEPDAVARLATAGRHVRDWLAIPVAVACDDARVRGALSAEPLGRHLIVTASILSALSAVLATPAPAAKWLNLAPHPTAARASRDFVTRTLLDWRLARIIPSATLVVSELVTSSTVYAGTDIALSVVWNAGALRLTIRDNSPRLPHQRQTDVELHGRGLTIVVGLTRAFGVLPTSDGGKVVWAVLDAPQPRSSARASRVKPATKEAPMVAAPDTCRSVLAMRRSPGVTVSALAKASGVPSH